MRRLAFSLAIALAACGGSGGDDGGGALGLDDFQAASAVVGQEDFVSRAANQGGLPDGTTLSRPEHRVAFAGGTLYVPDGANHRVLGFFGVPTTNGAAADFVLGQTDLAGRSSGTTASKFSSPLDCWSDGTRLFLVDAGNNRVLIWNALPTSNVPADVVVGQSTFTFSAPGAAAFGFDGPQSVAAAGGRLLVADTEHHRVLVWSTIPTSNGTLADLVLGQPTLFGLDPAGTGRSTLFFPEGVWTDGDRVVVADTGNSRVLVWTSFPTSNGQPADLVLGQADFLGNGQGLGPGGMAVPSAVFVRGDQLFVADTGSARVLVWDTFPSANGQTPDRVLGQSDLFHGTANDDDQDNSEDALASARTFRFPGGVFAAGDRVLVSDSDNHRVLIFDAR